MKTFKITHFFDVIKKEASQETEEVATPIRNNETNLKTKIKQESNIKEEIDIPWDDRNDIAEDDNIHSSEKNITLFNPRIVLDRLPNSIIQKYVERKTNNTNIYENNTESGDSEIIPEKRTDEVGRNVANKKLRSKTNLNKTVENCHDSQFYWKTCTFCNIRYDVVPNKRKMHACHKCNTPFIYECKKCQKQLTTITGMKYHMRSKCVNRGYYFKCFECDYKSANSSAVQCHIRVRHPTMVSQMHSRILQVECENVQTNLDKSKYKCSKCEKRFECLPNLLRHFQNCTGVQDKTDTDGNQSFIDVQSVRDRTSFYCEKCDYEVMYVQCIRRNNSVENEIHAENTKLCKKKCPHCKSIMFFKCTECKKQYESRHGLAGHIRSIHDTSRQNYKCSECDYKSLVLENLVNHYRWQHISEMHECSKCDMKFNCRNNLTKHSHRCGLQPKYNCEHCSYKSHNKDTLKRHILGRHMTGTRIVCPNCKHTFKNIMCLQAHKSTCGKSLDFQCNHCSFKTKYKKTLAVHSLRMHSTSNGVECPNCKTVQRNEQCLKDHLRYCNQKDGLQCKFCSYKTRYPSAFRGHVLRFHGKSNNSRSSIRSSSSNQENYRCDHCSYEAKVKGDIYYHIVMKHLKEQNIVCRRCNTTFQNSVLLSNHLKYCGLKPHLYCDQCSFTTYLKGQLASHMTRKHMTFECKKCKRIFKRKDCLQTHLNRFCEKKIKYS